MLPEQAVSTRMLGPSRWKCQLMRLGSIHLVDPVAVVRGMLWTSFTLMVWKSSASVAP